MQKFSSFGRKKKKQTKIRHRMVMLRHLQLLQIFTSSIEKHGNQAIGSYSLKRASNFTHEADFLLKCLGLMKILPSVP